MNEAVVSTCPGCAGHLGDTWNGEECGRCGFAYVKAEPVPTRSRSDPILPLKRTTAGVFAVMVAMFGGTGIASSEMITTVPTTSGVEAIAFNAPDGSFWFGSVLLFVAILLVAYATWDAPGGARA